MSKEMLMTGLISRLDTRSARRVYWAMLVTAALIGCDDKVATPPQALPVSVQVTPSVTQLEITQSGFFSAEVTGGDATTVRTVTWSLISAGIAALSSASGTSVVATGLSEGTTILVARTPQASGSATIIVRRRDTIQFVPPKATLTMGEVLGLTALIPGSPNAAITFRSRSPTIAQIVNRGMGAADLRGILPGPVVVDALGPDTTTRTTVQFNVEQPNLTLDSIMSVQGGSPLSASNLKGVVRLSFRIGNTARPDTLVGALGVDSVTPRTCAPPVGGVLKCTLNTARGLENDTVLFRPQYLNGLRSLKIGLSYPGGPSVYTLTTPATFANTDVLKVSEVDPTTLPPNTMSGTWWRGGDLVLMAQPVLFSTVINPSNIRIRLDVTRVSGTGNLFLSNTSQIPAPFRYTINSTISIQAEGSYSFTPRVFNTAGNEITSQFGSPKPDTVNMDFVPPRVSITSQPDTAYNLNTPTPKPFIEFTITGSVVDPSLASATVQLYRGVNQCDGTQNVIDDIPIAQGTGPGQSPTPLVNIMPSAGSTSFNFTTPFRLYTDNTLVGTTLCARVRALDKRINASGQPLPNFNVRVFTTMLRN